MLCEEGGGRAFAGGDEGAKEAGFAGSGASCPERWRGEALGPGPLHALSLLHYRLGLRLEGDTYSPLELQLKPALHAPCKPMVGWSLLPGSRMGSLTYSVGTTAQSPPHPNTLAPGISSIDGHRKDANWTKSGPGKMLPAPLVCFYCPLEAKPLKYGALASLTFSITVCQGPGEVRRAA